MTEDDIKRELLALLSEKPVRTIDADNPFAASIVRLYASGNKRPFYCVHPGSGAVGCFAEIAPRVDPDRPFFALQTPGIDGEREPFQDLKVLAAGYVREIRKAQPNGPYLIGGWSLGGTIAYQMAHELRAEGQTVAALVLFDTLRAEAIHAVRASALEISHRHNALATEHLARQRGIALDPDLVFERFKSASPRTTLARLELILGVLREARVFPDESTPMFRVFRGNLLALTDYGYPVERYDGKITLFRCSNEALGADFAQIDETYWWSRSTTQPVEIVRMPSHHFALFHGDVLPDTAARLKQCLDRADESPP